MNAAQGEARETIRLDKWLWQGRFFKTRVLAATLLGSGRVRVNGLRVLKPARNVAVGDVLTFPQAGHVRVVKVLALGVRRGSASEASALYQDLGPDLNREPDGTGPQPLE